VIAKSIVMSAAMVMSALVRVLLVFRDQFV